MNAKPLLVPALAATVAAGCGFDDPTPSVAHLRLQGDAGAQVTVIYSTTFIAAIDEVGVTQVQVFGHTEETLTLPVDLTIDIVENHQVFFQVVPAVAEKVSVQARVDIDGRVQVDDAGDIFAVDPWRFVYVFNRPTTRTIEIVL